MAKNLVIVESPAKAKTIEKYLKSDFKVLSSVGHIRSIAKKAVKGKPPVDINNDFEATYEVDPDKKKVIAQLKKAIKDSSTVWLATDEDREGEAIAWHLCEVLGLNVKTTNRIVFHEITKNAIEEALKKPRTVDMPMVEAQQARQILDRLVGFELSPVVWQKVPGGRSAGRVQSPAVRLVVEREREIQQFSSNATYKVSSEFQHNSDTFSSDLSRTIETEQEAYDFLESLKGAIFTVDSTLVTPGKRSPSAPFTTSTLQQEANSRLGFSAKSTMANAQKLYQSGKITYMRTDSMTLSDQAINQAEQFIKSAYGEQYSQRRTFKTKVINAQEAHEAIRPTDMSAEHVSSDAYEQKLYTLIRNRTLASQMAEAKIEKTTVKVSISNKNEQFVSKGEVVTFDGFLKVYKASKKDKILPKLNNGDVLEANKIEAKQTFSNPPARYTEGSLVKKLEELGIGRPSTYATIISTVQAREYVVKGESEGIERDAKVLELIGSELKVNTVTEKTASDRGKLVPTAIGMIMSDFLTAHFDRVVDYNFTAQIEQELDQIAGGELKKPKMLKDFYTPFHELIEKSGDIERSSVAQARLIGHDPKTNKPVYSRIGRFGPMVQLGETSDSEEKPVFAPMPKSANLETVTLEEALHALSLPRLVGSTPDGKQLLANIGRFGPFIQIGEKSDKKYVSIAGYDPHTITEQEALTVYQEKLDKEAASLIQNFEKEGIKIINGRYGPFVTNGTKNAKIDKKLDPSTIDVNQALEILANAPDKPKRFKGRYKSKK